MESFLKDIDGVLRDIIEAEKQGEDLILVNNLIFMN